MASAPRAGTAKALAPGRAAQERRVQCYNERSPQRCRTPGGILNCTRIQQTDCNLWHRTVRTVADLHLPPVARDSRLNETLTVKYWVIISPILSVVCLAACAAGSARRIPGVAQCGSLITCPECAFLTGDGKSLALPGRVVKSHRATAPRLLSDQRDPIPRCQPTLRVLRTKR